MARATTATDTAAYWLTQADRYDREALKEPARAAHWLKKAAEARAAAATYTATPTP